MADTTYALKVGDQGKERLGILNDICNPLSIAFLKKGGLKKGMSVLDLGCGTGIMSGEIEELVGPEGSVLGVDASLEQINIAQAHAEKKGRKNVSFKELSVHELRQLKGKFDALYARYILCHITAVEQVLKDVFELLKPGGLVFCEDLCGVDSLFCYPPNEGFKANINIIKAQFQLQNTDSLIGMKLPYMLIQAGFQRLFEQMQQPILRGSKEKSVFRLGVIELAPKLTSARLISDREIDEAQSKLEELEKDESVLISFFRYLQVASRKPG